MFVIASLISAFPLTCFPGFDGGIPATIMNVIVLSARAFAAGLALVAGFMDAFGYMRWHAFGSNMTGNTVIFAISLYRDDRSALLLPLALILSFVAGSALGRALANCFSPGVGLAGEAIFLTAAAFPHGRVGLALISIAMGMQNASIATFDGVRANTSFVTGDYSKLGEALAGFAMHRMTDENRQAISILSPLIAAYAAGAVSSAFLSSLSLAPLVVVPIVLALAYACYRGVLK